MHTNIRSLLQLTSSCHRHRVHRPGLRRASDSLLPGRLGAALLAALSILAMALILAAPAGAGTPIGIKTVGHIGAVQSFTALGGKTASWTGHVSPTTTIQGQPMTYEAALWDPTWKATPSGTVSFSVSGTTLCTATLRSSVGMPGVSGSCTTSNTPVHSDLVRIYYSGDDTFAPSDLGNFIVAVYPGPMVTTTAVTANPPASSEGDKVKYTATVRLVSDRVNPALRAGSPTGTVLFTMGGTQLCNKPIPLRWDRLKQQAECKSAKTPLGSGTVTATYQPDNAAFIGSSGTTTETVSARAVALPTTTSVTADPPTSTQGSQVTYLAMVKSPAAKTIPTGTVSFTAGPKGTKLCTAAIPLNGVGNAKCVSPRAPVGTNTVTATYQPASASFTGSSGTTTMTVTAPNSSTSPATR